MDLPMMRFSLRASKGKPENLKSSTIFLYSLDKTHHRAKRGKSKSQKSKTNGSSSAEANSKFENIKRIIVVKW